MGFGGKDWICLVRNWTSVCICKFLPLAGHLNTRASMVKWLVKASYEAYFKNYTTVPSLIIIFEVPEGFWTAPMFCTLSEKQHWHCGLYKRWSMWLHQRAMRCALGLLASVFPSSSLWIREIQVEFSSFPAVHFCSSLQLVPTRGREIVGIRCAVSQGFPGVMRNSVPPGRVRGTRQQGIGSPSAWYTKDYPESWETKNTGLRHKKST